MSRIICQFSCGAASAVATKLAIAQYWMDHEILIINAFIVNEHPDNRRFADDCERWFGYPITVLRDERFGADTHQVWKRERFLRSPAGAPCSRALKRKVLDAVKLPDDIVVFGYTAEEVDRLVDFKSHNPHLRVIAPLIDLGLGKQDCKAMIERAGIALPAMYQLGYDNANCIGCVKGGKGYWRAIREDFPEQFAAISAIEQDLGPKAYLFKGRPIVVETEYGPVMKAGGRTSLADLGDGPVRRNEELPSCSFYCEIAEMSFTEQPA